MNQRLIGVLKPKTNHRDTRVYLELLFDTRGIIEFPHIHKTNHRIIVQTILSQESQDNHKNLKRVSIMD